MSMAIFWNGTSTVGNGISGAMTWGSAGCPLAFRASQTFLSYITKQSQPIEPMEYPVSCLLAPEVSRQWYGVSAGQHSATTLLWENELLYIHLLTVPSWDPLVVYEATLFITVPTFSFSRLLETATNCLQCLILLL